jgi:hypothetical protein
MSQNDNGIREQIRASGIQARAISRMRSHGVLRDVVESVVISFLHSQKSNALKRLRNSRARGGWAAQRGAKAIVGPAAVTMTVILIRRDMNDVVRRH